jgi:hypothetical protein
MRLLCTIPSCVLIAFATAGQALALSIADRDLTELHADAQTIAEVRVTEIQGKCQSKTSCPGYRLVAVVERLWKDSMDSPSTISICSVIPLDINVRYTLFLSHPDGESTDTYRCTHLLGKDGAFEKRGTHTYRIRSHESAVIAPRFGQVYYTDAIRVADFEKQLAGVLSAKD